MTDALADAVRKCNGIDGIRNMDAFLIVKSIIQIIADFANLLAVTHGCGQSLFIFILYLKMFSLFKENFFVYESFIPFNIRRFRKSSIPNIAGSVTDRNGGEI